MSFSRFNIAALYQCDSEMTENGVSKDDKKWGNGDNREWCK